jgi:phenylpropionate dioxygenase-like ring-hydroxylating dioxygenase large terminal subunit
MSAIPLLSDCGAPDADIGRARTPSAGFYIDPARLADEYRTAIARSWQYVGHLGQLPGHGNYFVARVGHESLLLLRDGDAVRGFFNVCRHRAGPLAQGCGHATRIVCRYHGWTYDLRGQLLRATEMDGDFDPAGIRLEPVQVHLLGPLIFAALDPQTPAFERFHAGLARACEPFQLERMRYVMTRDYPVAANWKVYVDNYLEGYHLPLVHPALNREIDYRAYVTVLSAHHVLQHAPVRTGSASLYHQAAGEPDASYYWLFPNTMLNLYERQLQVNVVVPDGVGRAGVRFEWFALDADARRAEDPHFLELLRFTEQVQAEDAAICEAVQANLHSSAYRPGPYSPIRETGVHRFHRLMLTRSA